MVRGGTPLDEREIGNLSFHLDLSQPIYEQILEQMSGAVVRGDMMPGEKVPSVRDMAQALRVTPNTVMHAYQEMDRRGLTESRRGQGTFITESMDKIVTFREGLAGRLVGEFVIKMQTLGFSIPDVMTLLADWGKHEDA